MKNARSWFHCRNLKLPQATPCLLRLRTHETHNGCPSLRRMVLTFNGQRGYQADALLCIQIANLGKLDGDLIAKLEGETNGIVQGGVDAPLPPFLLSEAED